MPARSPRRFRWPLICLLLAALWLGYKWVMHVSPETMNAIAAELRQRKLPAGYHPDVPLTGTHWLMAVRGVVDVMVQPDGKLAIMLKTSEGWKHNYEGVLYVDTGFPLTLGTDYYGRPIPGEVFPTPQTSMVIRKKLSEQVYAVFWDLN